MATKTEPNEILDSDDDFEVITLRVAGAIQELLSDCENHPYYLYGNEPRRRQRQMGFVQHSLDRAAKKAALKAEVADRKAGKTFRRTKHQLKKAERQQNKADNYAWLAASKRPSARASSLGKQPLAPSEAEAVDVLRRAHPGLPVSELNAQRKKRGLTWSDFAAEVESERALNRS